MKISEIAFSLLLALLLVPVAAFAVSAAEIPDRFVFKVGDDPDWISHRKDPQGGGLGLAAFAVDGTGSVFCLDREGGKILVAGPDGKPGPTIFLPAGMVANDIFPARDGTGLWLVTTPPGLCHLALDGRVLEKRNLPLHTSTSSVYESPTGLLLIHDTAKNVAAIWKGDELRATLGGFFKPNLCLTGDSRLLQPGEKSAEGIDLLLHDPYKARDDEKFAMVVPELENSEILDLKIVGIDELKRVVVVAIELRKDVRHLVFHRFTADGKFIDRWSVLEEARCPVTLTRDFFLGPDSAVYSTGSSDETRLFAVYRHAPGKTE